MYKLIYKFKQKEHTSSASQKIFLNDLADELLFEIFKFLTYQDFTYLVAVCSRWKKLLTFHADNQNNNNTNHLDKKINIIWDFWWEHCLTTIARKFPNHIDDPHQTSKEKYLLYRGLLFPSNVRWISSKKYKLDKYLKTEYPLHKAVNHADVPAVHFFARSNIRINKVDPREKLSYGQFTNVTPLFLACINPKIPCNLIILLLNQGAVPQGTVNYTYTIGAAAPGVGKASTISTVSTVEAMEHITNTLKRSLIYLAFGELYLNQKNFNQAEQQFLKAKENSQTVYDKYMTFFNKMNMGFRPFLEDEKNWLLKLNSSLNAQSSPAQQL